MDLTKKNRITESEGGDRHATGRFSVNNVGKSNEKGA